MTQDLWVGLGLSEQEISALTLVNQSAVRSMEAHKGGRELKSVDKTAAKVANGHLYKSAIQKIHQAEKVVPEIDY